MIESYANDPAYLESYHQYFRIQDEIVDERRELENEIARLKGKIADQENYIKSFEVQLEFERRAHWACRDLVEELRGQMNKEIV